MNYNKKTVKDIDVAGKKVLLRCDFNVPQDKATGAITDDKRIVAALPTIQYLLEQNAAVIACSHLGKPKGEWKESLSLAPVAQHLSQLLGREVLFAKDIIGPDAQAKAAALQPGQIMLLENLRFDKGEEKNDPAFAKALADLAAGLCLRRLRHGPSRPRLHRRRGRLSARRLRLPDRQGAGHHGQGPGKPQASLRGHAGRRQGLRQDRRHQQPAGKGRHHHHRRRHGLHLRQGPGAAPSATPCWRRISWTTAREMMAKAQAKGVKFLLPVDNLCAAEFSADAQAQAGRAADIPDG